MDLGNELQKAADADLEDWKELKTLTNQHGRIHGSNLQYDLQADGETHYWCRICLQGGTVEKEVA